MIDKKDLKLWHNCRTTLGKIYKRNQGATFAKKVGIPHNSLTLLFGEKSNSIPNIINVLKVAKACPEDNRFMLADWFCRELGCIAEPSFKFTEDELNKNGFEIFKQWSIRGEDFGEVAKTVTKAAEDNVVSETESEQIGYAAQKAGVGFLKYGRWLLEKVKFQREKTSE